MSVSTHKIEAIPVPETPGAPDASRLWHAAVRVAWIAVIAFLLDRLALLLMDYWLLDSLGYGGVFWTNFKTGAVLFAIAFASSGFVIGPAFACGVPARVKRTVIHAGLMWGLLSGVFFSQRYMAFLMAIGRDFGTSDPVFGNDLGFYVFTLPPIWQAWSFALLGTLVALASWLLCAFLDRRSLHAAPGGSRLLELVARLSRPGTRATLGVLGGVLAIGWWLRRYTVLTMDNSFRSVYSGASYVDTTGLFSTINDYALAALVTAVVTGLVVVVLGRVRRGAQGEPVQVAGLLLIIGVLLGLDFCFKGVVALRQEIFVGPNEPVIQLPFIEAHLEATREGYGLNAVETVPLIPKAVGDPLPDIETLMASPQLRNASLWPGFCSYLEDLIDPQHTQRIIQTDGETMIYGPLLEVFTQQELLRAYYGFLDVDTVRYEIDGEKRILVSSVREVPLVEPLPWLAWWGQRFMLFTHGWGLVSAHASEVGPDGDPVYTSRGVPTRSEIPALNVENQRVYYGEGAGSMAYSNVDGVQELDYPTDEGRALVRFPPEVRAGVHVDSLLKRLVFGYASGQFFEIVMSELIGDDTRVHFYRMPLERVNAVLPLVYFDSDPFAVLAGDRMVWMLNGVTHSDAYPYSLYRELGDKSDQRTQTPKPHVRVNYVRDAVKATVDAYTGQPTFYKCSDEPVVETLAEIYPELFQDIDQMPSALRRQVQYPGQLMHLQFDDVYMVYHMDDPMTYFNMEDLWDDADEVLGPILDQGRAIRFSMEPFFAIVPTGEGAIPASSEPTQFVMTMVFTNERSLNLRAWPMVFQDGEDYGRLVCLRVPKGHYFMGPEQADAVIDQDPEIGQQITWWNRQGLQVIRGHTTAVLVEGEVIYIEPLFLRSPQNPVPKLKRVCVVFRGKAMMRRTLREALEAALAALARDQDG